MKNIKIITTILATMIGGTVIAGGVGTLGQVTAPAHKSVNQVLMVSRNQQNLTGQKAINYIQNHYLTQNANGTFSINPKASNVINSKDLKGLEIGMNNMNKLILQGKISFKLTKSSQGVIVKQVSGNVNPESMLTKKDTNIIKNQIEKEISTHGNSYQVCLSPAWINDYIYNMTNTWYGWYGDVYQGEVGQIAAWCYSAGNDSWGNTANIANQNGYTLTINYSNSEGIIGVSY